LLSDSAATTLRQLQQDEQGSARTKALTAVSDLQHFAAQTAELADAAERGADLTTLRSKVGHLERDITLLDKSLGEDQPSPVVRASWERTRAAFTRLLADLR
jgi:NTP pyrophosphatase (non-canonical NTP hydrolase)